MDYGYTVTSQSQSTEINPAGNGFISVWNVTYKVTSGPAANTSGTVTVPDDQHNAVSVKAAIEAKIAQLSDIASLGK
jgi:hypothetical protein